MKYLPLAVILCMIALLALSIKTQDLPPSPQDPNAYLDMTGMIIGTLADYSQPTTVHAASEEITFFPGESEKEVLITVSGDEYVYKYGYILDYLTQPLSWKRFSFEQNTVDTSNWISGTASATIPVKRTELGVDGTNTQNLYVVAYGCSKSGTDWDCHNTKWMLVNITAKGSEITAPVAPLNLVITSPASDSLVLTWDAVSWADGYNVYKSGTKITPSPITSTSYTDTGLTPSYVYTYSVSAVNSLGESLNSASVSQMTAPVLPTGLTVVPSAADPSHSLDLSWNLAAPMSTIFYVYRDGTEVARRGFDFGMTTGKYTDAGLTQATTYSYTIKAVNSGGESPQTAPVSAMTTVCPLATSRIEAEAFTSNIGVQTSATSQEASASGGAVVGWIENGDSVTYDCVDFGTTGTSSIDISAGVDHVKNANAEVWVDGAKIATCYLPITGGFWTYAIRSCSATVSPGQHKIQLKFMGGNGVNDYIANFDWFQFSTATVQEAPFCGNSIINAGETCDNGAQNGVVPCAGMYGATCPYCSSSCIESIGKGPYCGDGIPTSPQEQCDGSNFIGSNTCYYATNGQRPQGTVSCSSSCQLDTSQCTCTPYWDCTQWSECLYNSQYQGTYQFRTCVDRANCPTYISNPTKPSETQYCTTCVPSYTSANCGICTGFFSRTKSCTNQCTGQQVTIPC